MFKEEDNYAQVPLNKDIFESEYDDQDVILTRPSALLKVMLGISMGNHKAVLFFLKDF